MRGSENDKGGRRFSFEPCDTPNARQQNDNQAARKGALDFSSQVRFASFGPK